MIRFHSQQVAEDLLALNGFTKPPELADVPWEYQQVLLKQELEQLVDPLSVGGSALRSILDSLGEEYETLSPAMMKKIRKNLSLDALGPDSAYAHMDTLRFLVQFMAERVRLPESMFSSMQHSPRHLSRRTLAEHPTVTQAHSYLINRVITYWIDLEKTIVNANNIVLDEKTTPLWNDWLLQTQKFVTFGSAL